MPIRNIELARNRSDAILFRAPRAQDGAAVWRLVRSCKPLDENSLYCNLLQCDHFCDTSIIAERSADSAVVGWISGYLIPREPDTLFVWQVAVDPIVRGRGLAGKMLSSLIGREACSGVRRLKTTITPDNEASWAFFASFARRYGEAELKSEPYFHRDSHFGGEHATEHMVTIALAQGALCAA
ncbi:diaminobutyrate acetyltransferase [Chelativorans sp. Marseille-P2723]|uniref:diaminobutyrate acetyltransferase n=1 Tax=Chelativorans sp. Marseille-P2723 TaxID=2709133 RepID=UPI00156F6D46|nr:diaminobutyrate acetyltransferase [Chelativorans sp. Marseille-P2723]